MRSAFNNRYFCQAAQHLALGRRDLFVIKSLYTIPNAPIDSHIGMIALFAMLQKNLPR